MVRGSRSLLILVLVLLVSIIGPFLIWGEWFDRVLTLEGARAWMESLGHWAALGGVLLLVADLFLPIPGTVVMSALGWMYGWWWGGWLAAAGSWLAGVVAYGLSRWVGRPAARWLAGEEGLERAHGLFERRGGWMVAVSRWLPVLPEAVACLAGLAGMQWRRFVLALTCGSLPVGFAFAAIGHLGQAQPGWAVALSALVPVVLWWAARRWV